MPKKRFLSYEMAKEYMRDIQQKMPNYKWSSKNYKEWHKLHKPPIPVAPNRVYKEWVSWNDFLGTSNTFYAKEKITHLPYWDAVRWAQKHCIKHNITKVKDWAAQFNTDDGYNHTMPPDIPRRPEVTYGEQFRENGGWKTWFGVDTQRQIQAQQQNISLMAVCNIRTQPGNVIEVVIAREGITDLRSILEGRGDLKAIEVYQYGQDSIPHVQQILHRFAFDKGYNVYSVPNLNELLFELSSILVLYRPNHQNT